MATVPQVKLPSVAIRPADTPYQSANVNSEAFGAPIAQGLNSVTQSLNQAQAVSMQLDAQARATATQDADNQFSDQLRQVLFDPDTGYYNLKGKAAYDGYKDVSAKIAEMRQAASDNISDPMARQRFDQVSSARVTAALGEIDRYASDQKNIYADATDDASVNNAISQGGLYYNNPDQIDLAKASINHYVNEKAERNGWAPEVTQQALKDNQTKLQTAIISGMAAHDPAAAYDYYLKNADDMNPLSGEFVNALKSKAIERRAQGNVNAVLQMPTPMVTTKEGGAVPAPDTAGGIANQVAQVAQQNNVAVDEALTTINIESHFKPDAKNGSSTARGLGQITDGTYQALGGDPAKRDDPTENINLAVKYIQQNRQALRAGLGREPEGWENYIAYQQGANGAMSLLRADPNAPAAAIVGKDAVANNISQQDQAPIDPSTMTVSEFLAYQQQRYANNYISANQLPGMSSGNRMAQYQKLQTISDPDERAESLKQWQTAISQQDTLQNADVKDAHDQGFSAVLQGVDPRNLPVDTVRRMGPDNYAKLKDYYDTSQNKIDTQTSARTEAQLTDMEVRDPAQFQQLDLSQFVLNHQLTPTAYKTYRIEQQKAQADATTNSLKLLDDISKPLLMGAGITEPTANVNAFGKTAGGQAGGDYNTNAQQYADFKAKAYDAVRGIVASTGKQMSGQDVEKLVKSMVTQATFIDNNSGQESKDAAPLFTIQPGQTPVAIEIPTGDKARLLNAMTNSGFTAGSDHDQREIYASLMTGDLDNVVHALQAHSDQYATRTQAQKLYQAYLNNLPPSQDFANRDRLNQSTTDPDALGRVVLNAIETATGQQDLGRAAIEATNKRINEQLQSAGPAPAEPGEDLLNAGPSGEPVTPPPAPKGKAKAAEPAANPDAEPPVSTTLQRARVMFLPLSKLRAEAASGNKYAQAELKQRGENDAWLTTQP